jgi:transposase
LDQVQIWFQDEARIGQQGSLSRIWAQKGTRPRVVRQQQFIYQYIYGAVCPQEGKAACIIAPSTRADVMQLHLDEVSLHIPVKKHAVVIMDRASWHKSKALKTPDNISILYLPPYSPELNPQEAVWRVLKDRFFHNRSYESAEEISEISCQAWNSWISNPENIFSLCHRTWATLC